MRPVTVRYCCRLCPHRGQTPARGRTFPSPGLRVGRPSARLSAGRPGALRERNETWWRINWTLIREGVQRNGNNLTSGERKTVQCYVKLATWLSSGLWLDVALTRARFPTRAALPRPLGEVVCTTLPLPTSTSSVHAPGAMGIYSTRVAGCRWTAKKDE
jgi:hypothetical protein